MADLKPGVITAFLSGEMTPEYAGRIDKDESKYAIRYGSNFVPMCQGGLKKFFGTYLAGKLPINVLNGPYKLVPFDGADRAICLLFVNSMVYSVDSSGIYQQSFSISSNVIEDCDYKQVNDVIYFASANTAPFSINYVGYQNDVPTFSFSASSVINEPFFPVGWNGNYDGPMYTDGYSGNITVNASDISSTYYSLELPDKIKTMTTSVGCLSEVIDNAVIRANDGLGTRVIGNTYIELVRVRDGEESTVISALIGNNQYGEKQIN